MHPMMALAALRGCVAIRHYTTKQVRIVAKYHPAAAAVYDGWYSEHYDRHYTSYVGQLGSDLKAYEPAELSDFTSWDDVTEAMLDQLLP